MSCHFRLLYMSLFLNNIHCGPIEKNGPEAQGLASFQMGHYLTYILVKGTKQQNSKRKGPYVDNKNEALFCHFIKHVIYNLMEVYNPIRRSERYYVPT